MAEVSISCPIADSQRQWLQQSRAPASSVANTTFALCAVPVGAQVDVRPVGTTFHLPAFKLQVSPPLLI
jgi:hypothetical protein